jgi:hypothetical protein
MELSSGFGEDSPGRKWACAGQSWLLSALGGVTPKKNSSLPGAYRAGRALY